jgi:adenylosuccinate lyase
MDLCALTAVSPVDGRYADKTAALREYFSEYGLIKRRVAVEVAWVLQLAESGIVEQLPPFDADERKMLEALSADFGLAEAQRVKTIERTTTHDDKGVAYYLTAAAAAAASGSSSLQRLKAKLEFFHFACTSEDINNLSYALMLRDARRDLLAPLMCAARRAATAVAAAQPGAPAAGARSSTISRRWRTTWPARRCSRTRTASPRRPRRSARSSPTWCTGCAASSTR